MPPNGTMMGFSKRASPFRAWPKISFTRETGAQVKMNEINLPSESHVVFLTLKPIIVTEIKMQPVAFKCHFDLSAIQGRKKWQKPYKLHLAFLYICAPCWEQTGVLCALSITSNCCTLKQLKNIHEVLTFHDIQNWHLRNSQPFIPFTYWPCW